MPFSRGNKLAPGGARPQKLKTEWLTKLCAKEVREGKLIQRLAKIARGEMKDYKFDHTSGKVVEVPVSIHDQKDAQQYLIDRVGGKAQVMMDLTSGGGPVTVRMVNYADMIPKLEVKKVEEPKA